MCTRPASSVLTSLAVILALGAAAACGGNGDGDDDDQPQPGDTIVVSPATATLTVINGAAVEQPYTAVLRHTDGTEVDVTADATFAVDLTSVGYFSGGSTLTASGAGRARVTATYEGLAGTATVEVFREDVRVVEPAPAGAADLFDAATDDPGRVATIVYPSHNTIVPPNLGDFDVHWTDASGSDLFEISVKTYYADVRVYVATAAAAGAWLALLESEWTTVARSEVGATLTVTVRGLTQASPTTSSRADIQVHTAREEIQGGIYYWAAASAEGGPTGIFRHDMSRAGEEAEPFYTNVEAGRCVACHVLSRDGTKMALTYDGGNQSATVVDVATRTPAWAADQYYWNFATFTPDGGALLTSFNGGLTLRDPATAAAITTVPTSGYATHPDFSPDGTRLVYVRPSGPGSDWAFTGGALVTTTFDGTTFGAETPLLSSAENNYYPSFSPDGEWVLFNRSTEDAYDDGSAELWVMRADGTVGPIKLDAANIGAGLTNSWARWAPFEGSYGPDEAIEPIYWLTFSTKRNFGVRLVGANRPQVWMTPFFPTRAAAGQDATAPAFRLPFQDLESSNHIAQWTERVVPVE